MQSVVVTWALYTAALAVVAWLLPGFKIKGGLGSTIAVAALFGLLNWLLAGLLELVLGVLTLGLLWLLSFVAHAIVTALVLKLTDALTDKLEIKSFWVALVGAAIMSLTVTGIRTFILPLVGIA